MKPAASLFAKILSWFLLNIILVAAALAIFFAFQQQINLHAIFGQQGTNRLRTAGMLIVHDLNRMPRADWPDILARHAAIHRVDFMLALKDGTLFSSTGGNLPRPVMARIRGALRHKPSRGRFQAPMRPQRHDNKPHLMMRTRHPTRYWSGIQVNLGAESSRFPLPAFLLAASDSMTGNGFFFDPLPWMVVAAAVILISVLFWIPMIRNITRPLARMTRATEEIANGCFDVSIREPRADEIGRLAKAISHMSARLSAYVKGQKRFLGDVAHELGSPIARIQFGLGALEQRVGRESRQRVVDVMEDVEQLSELVNELLAFSRADMQSKSVKLEEIDLLPVVQTAIKRETTPAAEINVRIDPEIRVVASAELLTRAMANLVRNAVKYAGGAGPIEVSAKKTQDGVEIEVRDAGSGVPEYLLDQLFEPFFRPEPSRDRDSGGAGLGLAIVKTCVQTCNGSVTAANLSPEGFAVKITLTA